MAAQPFDVASGDPHSVGPWFAGKLDFAPKVRDLAAQGFPVVGGRVDYFDGRRVAAIVFRDVRLDFAITPLPHRPLEQTMFVGEVEADHAGLRQAF